MSTPTKSGADSTSGAKASGLTVSNTVSNTADKSKGVMHIPDSQTLCEGCMGTGEYASDFGVVDCPDCDGAGYVPSRKWAVERRLREVGRANDGGLKIKSADVKWLLAELKRSRDALQKVAALSHDAAQNPQAATQIEVLVGDALGEPSRRRVDGE